VVRCASSVRSRDEHRGIPCLELRPRVSVALYAYDSTEESGGLLNNLKTHEVSSQ
jgi:hypothetical protein